MSGSNVICTLTVLLEMGIVQMMEPVTKMLLHNAVGLWVSQQIVKMANVRTCSFDNIRAYVTN